MKVEPSTVVIYHAGCIDGLAAAWMFKSKYNDAIYHHAYERCFYRDTRMPDLTNKDVFIVDYSYCRAELIHIRQMARSVVLLDHHQTTLAEITPDIPGVTAVVDVTKCAAEIVWEFLFDKPKPWWMVHIRDRDLWEWKDPRSQIFAAAIDTMDLSMNTMSKIAAFDGRQRANFYKLGTEALKYQNKLIVSILKFAELVEFENHSVWAINSLHYKNELGAVLSTTRPGQFALIYRYSARSNEWFISLRADSRGGIDLTTIAKKYGGGGHPNACGFKYSGDISELFQAM